MNGQSQGYKISSFKKCSLSQSTWTSKWHIQKLLNHTQKYFKTWIDLLAERGIKPSDKGTLKLGMDDGGGFFKVCANYVFENKDQPKLNRARKHVKARWRSKFKDSSVKHSLIIAIVEDIPEVNPTLELIFIKPFML